MAPSRIKVQLENLANAIELEVEKEFVRTHLPGINFNSWRYGEVIQVDGHATMAASFAVIKGTYVLINSSKPRVRPPIHTRDMLKETYQLATGKKINTLKLVVGWNVMNPLTLRAFINASEVLRAQGVMFFQQWIALGPGSPGWDEMEESNHFINTLKKVLAEDPSTQGRAFISMVEFYWAPDVAEQFDRPIDSESYKQHQLHVKAHISQ